MSNPNFIGLTLIGNVGQSIEVVSFIESFNMYQCKETNSNGIETNPLLSHDDIQTLINKQSSFNQSIHQSIQQTEQDKKEEEQLLLSQSIGNFLINNPKAHGKAKKILNTDICYNGKYMTRKDYIQSCASNPHKQPTQQKNKWYIHDHETNKAVNVTKTEIDYYYYLLSEREEETTQSDNTQPIKMNLQFFSSFVPSCMVNTSFHPSLNKEDYSVKYQVEYTDKDEDIDINYTNLITLETNSLQETIDTIFRLKVEKKYNINAWYTIYNGTQWIVEDTSHNLEWHMLERDKKLYEDERKKREEAEEKVKQYEAFINKYKSSNLFEKFMEDNQ